MVLIFAGVNILFSGVLLVSLSITDFFAKALFVDLGYLILVKYAFFTWVILDFTLEFGSLAIKGTDIGEMLEKIFQLSYKFAIRYPKMVFCGSLIP